ncbi:5'-methylthioadenosine phosphorylase [Sphingomonas guangdongensis]|uniref:S-methyl-5'-thioadenosine phosphorylase n=1 Tax=Sphingomonas guangdongensis TaxID=1141890 RepID=A0A285QBG1_9SPHN|nr:5'-methylthioadenosine phosphorylase [Sphingomonas guangdongensis]SOB79285.1 5'-methylthioadenosine phosphorylase [Sphingomonas guangdongensis]
MTGWTIGIIGGSGLYDIAGLAGAWERVETPWGAPSDAIFRGRVGAVDVAFLPRHGRGHVIPPGDINARANIAALKLVGCTDVVAISSVGSLVAERPPGSFSIVDQFIDRTKGRPSSFFGPGLVAHVSMADPVCPRLSALLADAMPEADRGGTYLAMEGPQFSTRAESRLYRSWGAHVIGMTAMPEARLAREAELPYALVGMVTDLDSWHEGEGVDVAQVLAQVGANTARARTLGADLLAALPAERAASPIDANLDTAIITPRSARDPVMVERLASIAGRVLR